MPTPKIQSSTSKSPSEIVDATINRWRNFVPTHKFPYPGATLSDNHTEEYEHWNRLLEQHGPITGDSTQALHDVSAVLAGTKPAAYSDPEFFEKHPVGQELMRRVKAAGHAVMPVSRVNGYKGLVIGKPEAVAKMKDALKDYHHGNIGRALGYPEDKLWQDRERDPMYYKRLGKVLRYSHDMVYPADPHDVVGKLAHADYLDEHGLHTQAARQRWYAGLIHHVNHPDVPDGPILHLHALGLPTWAYRLASIPFAHQMIREHHQHPIAELEPYHKHLVTAERIGLGLDGDEEGQRAANHITGNTPYPTNYFYYYEGLTRLLHNNPSNTDNYINDQGVPEPFDPITYFDWHKGDTNRFNYTRKVRKYLMDNPLPSSEPQPNPHKFTNSLKPIRYNKEAFEANIDANPHDVTNRLVYADWLDENDQPHEAAFQRSMAKWIHDNGGVIPARRDHEQEGEVTMSDIESRDHPYRMAQTAKHPDGVDPNWFSYTNERAYPLVFKNSPGRLLHETGYDRRLAEDSDASWHSLKGEHSWPTYRGMEEAFRRSFMKGRGL